MRSLLALACLALLLAGCGTVGSGIRDEGAAALGDKAAVSPAAAAGEDTSAAVPATASPGTAFVYFLRYDQPEPTRRSVASDLSIPEGSLRALLTGPTPAEATLHYGTALPAEARLLAFSVVRRTAIIDISQMPDTAAGSETEALLALYQLVYTVTANGAIDAVQVRVAGRPFGLNSLAGGSSALEPPLTRADLSFVIDATTLAGSTGCAVEKAGAAPFTGTPSVTIARPRAEEPVSGSLQLRGTVENAAGPLVIRILQDQLEVANRIIDEPCRGRFAASIPIPRTLTGSVTLMVISPADGERAAASAERSLLIAG